MGEECLIRSTGPAVLEGLQQRHGPRHPPPWLGSGAFLSGA